MKRQMNVQVIDHTIDKHGIHPNPTLFPKRHFLMTGEDSSCGLLLRLDKSMGSAGNACPFLPHVQPSFVHDSCAKIVTRGGTAVSSFPRVYYFVILHILFLFSFFLLIF